jgi:K+-sensing histidine kinase KdpD
MIAANDPIDLAEYWGSAALHTPYGSLHTEPPLELTPLQASLAVALDADAIAGLRTQISTLAATADYLAAWLPVLSPVQISGISAEIHRTVRALQVEIENWLIYARVLAGRLQLQVQSMDPMNLLLAIAPVCDALLAPRGQWFAVGLGTRYTLLAVDQHLMQQAIVNMVAEISALSRQQTPIDLAVSVRDGRVRIAVQGYRREPAGAALAASGNADGGSPGDATSTTPLMHLAQVITRVVVAAHGGRLSTCWRRGSNVARWVELPAADRSALSSVAFTRDDEVRYESTAG